MVSYWMLGVILILSVNMWCEGYFVLFNQGSRGFIIFSISVCEYVIPEAAFVVSIQVNVVGLVGMFLMMIANTSDIYELLWFMSTITKANLFLRVYLAQ